MTDLTSSAITALVERGRHLVAYSLDVMAFRLWAPKAADTLTALAAERDEARDAHEVTAAQYHSALLELGLLRARLEVTEEKIASATKAGCWWVEQHLRERGVRYCKCKDGCEREPDERDTNESRAVIEAFVKGEG